MQSSLGIIPAGLHFPTRHCCRRANKMVLARKACADRMSALAKGARARPDFEIGRSNDAKSR
jgi:hypothetical protein